MATDSSAVASGGNAPALSEAAQAYVRQLPEDAKQRTQPELARFIRWLGPERCVAAVTPPEIGEYSEMIGARGTSPDAAERLGMVKAFLAHLKKQGLIEMNLAQHLRLRKSRSSGKGKAMAGPAEIRLTRAGHIELTKRLAQYQTDRIRITEEIQKAAADKDVRENAPLEAAREAQGMLMAKIQEIETTLRSAVVIDGEDGDGSNRVQLGSKVTLKEMTSERSTNYQLVDPDEASPLNGKISSASPVGAAILGRSPGQEVQVETPRGRQRYLIVKTS